MQFFWIHIKKIPIDILENLPKNITWKKNLTEKIYWNQTRIILLSKSPCQNILLNLARATIVTIHTLLAVVVVAFFSAFAEISKATQHFNIMRYSFRGLYILCINRLRCRSCGCSQKGRWLLCRFVRYDVRFLCVYSSTDLHDAQL